MPSAEEIQRLNEELEKDLAKHRAEQIPNGEKLIVQPVELHPGFYDGPTVGDRENKGHRIVRDCTSAGEPFFVLRAKDLLSVPAIKQYFNSLSDYEGDDPTHVIQVGEILAEFKTWQRQNPDKVRLPD